MELRFFENPADASLLPLTATRPPAALRVGIRSIAEKWLSALSPSSFGFLTRSYLQKRYPDIQAELHISGNVLPNDLLVKAIIAMGKNETLTHGGDCVAYTGSGEKIVVFESEVQRITRPFHIFKYNGAQITYDFNQITHNRHSIPLSPTNTHIGSHPVFLEEGAVVECCILNTSNGPIYVGKNAQIMEGSMLRGPIALCEGANIKMGSKIYGDTTIGPYSNVGGEVNNVVIQGYSNKGHDGFLGNAVLGEWCNIGADTNASNLKNTYDDVKVWNYQSKRFDKSGEQFCGLIMGDHSKCGINTMFNTGTVIGVGANLFGAGFPRQFIPDFSWGGVSGFVTHQLPQMEKTAQLMMQRRKRDYDLEEQEIIRAVYELTTEYRSWEREALQG